MARRKRQIAAKPTVYAGVEFRSRLEARHAVFYDALGCRWEYEPWQWVMPNGWTYTVDFQVSHRRQSILVEVKPEIPRPEYLEEIREVIDDEPLLFLLAVGGFYQGMPPHYYTLPREESHPLRKVAEILSIQRSLDEAINTAASYRFDI